MVKKRKRRASVRKKPVLNKERRDFIKQAGLITYGAVLAKYLPTPAPVAQLPPITGTVNATLEPVVGHVRWNTFVAVDMVSIKLRESQSVERV